MTRADAATSSSAAGLGPHGERAAGPELAALTQSVREEARSHAFEVALLLHTRASDWSRRQIAGIEASLAEAGAKISDIIDCEFSPSAQVAAIDRLIAARPDAVIAIPVGGTVVTDAFRRLATSGVRLILLDNVPSGLLPESDYASAVSCDNFRLGQIAAELLSPHVPPGGRVCVAAYSVDFFATAQREIGFDKWMRCERPDIRLAHLKFETPARAVEVIATYLEKEPEPDGVFIVWDEPAVAALPVLSACKRPPAMTTVDLGAAAAAALGEGRILCGVAAQNPFRQGAVAAAAAILVLTGRSVPSWIVVPALTATPRNASAVYREVSGAETLFTSSPVA
ncbi:substrate-binding domain-containing protein [Aureimonas jatrophae]|uniref:Ribose transport system substrate-binding protein n=1 Tax=Aureimonas jatrophae TaxID=1166073 RepID=A0A1H0EIF0_9HYPH|nr:substrate-binding domain-containing protein [Aureimonas jatrophae]SDN82059.1 ribose transport system substrate-binding protein [Aureimonas jatrophae]